MTAMATSHMRWAVVMSRNAGFNEQCVELDFQYPSEGIHRRRERQPAGLTPPLPPPELAWPTDHAGGTPGTESRRAQQHRTRRPSC